MALVKFIEHDNAGAAESGVGEQTPRQHAFGEEPQPRPRAAHVFKPHLIADSFTNTLAQFARHASGRHAGRQPPRFEHQDVARIQREQSRRDACCLSGSGRGLDHQILPGAQCLDDAGQ